MANRCFACDSPLTSDEVFTGTCPVCNARLPSDSPLPVAPPRRLDSSESGWDRWRKPIVWSLLVFTLASFFVPGGMIWSIATWFSKGHSLCAWGGCYERAEKTIRYQSPRESATIGYCQRHFNAAPKSLTSERRGRSLSGLLTAIFGLGPAMFALWYFLKAAQAYQREPDAMKHFAALSLAAIVPMNVASYFYWMHLEWILRSNGL